MFKNNKGFSLVETIIVIAIMAVLISILAPQLLRQLGRAREGVCLTNKEQFVRLFDIYAVDADDDVSIADFLVYAEDLEVTPDKICPSKGTCSFEIIDKRLVVTCSTHSGGG